MVPVGAVHHGEFRGLARAGELKPRPVPAGHRRRSRRRGTQLLRVRERVVVVVMMVAHAVVRVHHARETYALHARVRVVRGRRGQAFHVNGTHAAAAHLTGGVRHRRGRP